MVTVISGYYVQPHQTQKGTSARLARMGCTPTSGSNGIIASSGGKIVRTPEQVLALIPPSQEQNPKIPGWSLVDLDNAMLKIGVGFEKRRTGWTGATSALDTGYYIVLQGDSDQFSNNTCSGVFDGNHAIGVHPGWRLVDGHKQYWIDDPLCSSGRWEYASTLYSYAHKLDTDILFGVFLTPVPKRSTVVLRYGGQLVVPKRKPIKVAPGHKANVRTRPTTAAPIALYPSGGKIQLGNTQSFVAYQVTKSGQLLAGSRVWYGNDKGNQWLHETAF